VAGLVVAAIGVGHLIGDLPAGALAGRIGERRAMLAAAALDVVAMSACVIAGSVWLLGAAIFCAGLAGAVWGLARQAYLAEVVPFHLRARAMSTLGGVHRIGRFIGPFLGAGVVSAWGTDGAYALNAVAVLAAAALLVSLPEPEGRHPHASTAGGDVRILDVARSHLPIFYTLGVGILLIGAVRASRDVVLPLWADALGFDAATTSLVFGIAGAVDMLLFYPAGKVMDRVGRAFVAVPSMVVLAAAHFLLPLTHDLTSLSLVALLMGFGNGIGSGIVMTLGADLSPSVGRPAFLGAWRLCADAGNSGGPLLVGTVSASFALGPAIVLMGGLGLLGAVLMGRYIPRYVPSPRTRSRPTVVEADHVLPPSRTQST
jgi:MFS family permease